jgi:DNA-binding transcriptional LysR family regulator
VELRELTAFVAVVEEGGMSAASRRLRISQPALSQTVGSLERQLGIKLLERSSTGVRPTDAGAALLAEARAILARHQQALRRMAEFTTEGRGALRLGVPMELPPHLLQTALAKFTANSPDTRVMPRHLSTAAQVPALRSGEIDVGLMRERPAPEQFDAMLVVRENLGVLLASELAAGLVGPQGVRLDALTGLQWLYFLRSDSPAWHDEVTAIMRSHGVDLGPPPPEDQQLIVEVKLAAVTAGGSFALAPENWAHPIPDSVTWCPLVGHPLVRRTWVVWPADSRRRDIGQLVTAFELPTAR